MMKSAAIFVCTLLAVLALPQTAAAAGPKDCYKGRTTTLDAGKSVRVFYRGKVAANTKFACYLKTGRVKRLGAWDADLGAAGIANLVSVSGSFVAYHNLQCAGRDGDCAESDVRVLNVRTGALRRAPKAGAGAAGLAGLVVRSSGQAAYLREYADGSRQLHLLDASSDQLVDTGPDIEPFSLAFAGPRLYWTRGGVAQSRAR